MRTAWRIKISKIKDKNDKEQRKITVKTFIYVPKFGVNQDVAGSRKIVRGPRGQNYPPGIPNLALCPTDFSLNVL